MHPPYAAGDSLYLCKMTLLVGTSPWISEIICLHYEKHAHHVAKNDCATFVEQ